MVLNLSITTVSLFAQREERVIGRDMPMEGLLLPEKTLHLVEHLHALETLAEFGELAANWDGYGASPINGETLGNSKGALSQLIRYVSAPEIAPSPNGTVTFEWISGYGEAHLEMGKTRFSFFVRPKGGRAILAEGAAAGLSADIGSLIAAIVFPNVRPAAAITTQTYTAGHERASG